MADPKDLESVRESTEKAKAYFSNVGGFQSPSFEKPAEEPTPAPGETAPAAPARPEPPLSEAEKAWKGIMGK